MKFSYKLIDGVGRIGKLMDFVQHSGTVLETPLFVLTAKGLSLPHVTFDALEMLTKDPVIIQFPLNALAPHADAISDQGLAKFVALKDSIAYCSVADPLHETPSGYNDKAGVSVWTKCGRVQVNPQKYSALIKCLKADIVQSLCDGDTNEKSAKKRIRKSVTSTTTYLKHHVESNDVETLVAAVEGGYSLQEREVHAKMTSSERGVAAYSIDGLHNNGPDVQNIAFSSIKPVLDTTLTCLPEGKLRILHGAWSPQVVVDCVKAGIDVFDSSLPYVATERGAALVFQFRHVSRNCEENGSSGDKEDIVYEIDLSKERFRKDHRRLCCNCECYTCGKYTRSYVHYLLSVNEMQAKVMLMMHNLHHYFEFFKEIRLSLKNSTELHLEQVHLES